MASVKRGINKRRAAEVQLGNKRYLAGACGEDVLERRRSDGEIRRAGEPRDVRVPAAVDGQRVGGGAILAAATKREAIDQDIAGGVDFCSESIAVWRLRPQVIAGKVRIKRGAHNIGIAKAVDSDTEACVTAAVAKKGGVDQALAVGRKFGDVHRGTWSCRRRLKASLDGEVC